MLENTGGALAFGLGWNSGGGNNLTFRTNKFGIASAPLLTLNFNSEPSSFSLIVLGLGFTELIGNCF
jgi:hypothetical protein